MAHAISYEYDALSRLISATYNNGTTLYYEYDAVGNITVVTNDIVAMVADSDADGIKDTEDNCLVVVNFDQLDADNDGYGNLCDADFNNDGMTNNLDIQYFRQQLNTADANADLNADGIVNVADWAIMRALYDKPPGPAASP